jgi:UDP-N-acetylmuramate dehydrogenase
VPLFLPQFNLQAHNTLAVPASAAYFVTVTTTEELRAALRFAKAEQLPLLVLGGGSNIVLRDNFSGLVVQLRTQGKTPVAETEEHLWLKVAAGENWQDLVDYSLNEGYYGLENLALIPGSVGAAPIQNIGAYGVELKDVFAELTALELASGLEITFTHENCGFGYRDSIFKQALKDKYVITSVTFKLTKRPHLKLSYPALRAALMYLADDEITPLDVRDAVVAIRSSKLPDPREIPNVGSFFKNPVISALQYESLLQCYPELVAYPQGDTEYKLAAAWLIDQAGWRGKSFEGARVHDQQALVLTNPNKLTGAAVLALAAQLQEDVQLRFGVTLEMEPRVYP